MTFAVISGPNTGVLGTCSVNTDCTTDANGQVSFTYSGSAGQGTDEIKACFTNQAGAEVCSQVVTKEWVNRAAGLLEGRPEPGDHLAGQPQVRADHCARRDRSGRRPGDDHD